MALLPPSIGVDNLNANRIGLYIEQANSAEQKLGLVQNLNWDEDFQVQPWQILGRWGPAGFVSLGYTLSLNIGLFMPVQQNIIYPDKGVLSAHDLEWTRDKAQRYGRPLVMDKLIVKDEGAPDSGQAARIIDIFYQTMLTRQSSQIQSGQQVMRNCSFMAISRENPNSGLPVSSINQQ